MEYEVYENGQLVNNYQQYLLVDGAFDFFVKVDLKRKPGTTNSTISISTHTNSTKTAHVVSKVQWAHSTAAPVPKYTQLKITSHTHHLSPLGIMM